MGRLSLGKNVGTTDKKTSRKHTPTGDSLGVSTPLSPVEVIKKPPVIPQKWQGSTFISNPGPTLVPQLKLPSLKNVLAPPNRDFEQLASALSTFDKSLVKYATSKIELGQKQKDYWSNEAERVISQNPSGSTSLDQLASIKAELNKNIVSPYTQEDIDNSDGTITQDQLGAYPEGHSAESVESAKDQLHYIQSNSRLHEAIESKYKERNYLSNASSLGSAQKIATIKGKKVITEDAGDGTTKQRVIEIDIPLHTLSPNDPRYIKWVDQYLAKPGIQLNGFEYNNIKGKVIQYRTNAATSQSANYATHLDDQLYKSITETTTDIGSQLATQKITEKDAAHEMQELIERMNLHGLSEDKRKLFNEELAINLIAAFTKGSESGYSDPEVIRRVLGMLAIGPKESRVNSKGELNTKQLWLNGFETGWLDQRYNDALQRIKGHDSKSQDALNARIGGLADTNYEENIRPLLFDKGELAPENMNKAITILHEWKEEQIRNAKTVEEERAINKAVKNLEQNIYGVFSGDYRTDSSMLNRLFYAAVEDPTKMPRFQYYLKEFNSRWAGYSKADTLSNNLQTKSANIVVRQREAVMETFDSTLGMIEKWYVQKWGVLPNSAGGTDNFEEQANWEIIKRNLMNRIFEELGPGASEEEIKAKLQELTKDWTGALGGDLGTSDRVINQKLPFLEDLLDGRRIDYRPRFDDGPKYKGNMNDALSLFNTGKSNKLNLEQRTEIKLIHNSTQPFFEANTIEAITDQIFKSDPTKEINLDPRLYRLIEHLPGRDKKMVGSFLIREFEKHGIKLDDETKQRLMALNKLKVNPE